MHSIYISISLQTWMLYSVSICEIAGFAKVLIFSSKYSFCVRNIKSSTHIRRDSLTSSSGGSIKLHCFISFYKEHFFFSLQKQFSCSSYNIFIYIYVLTYYIVSRTFHLCYLRFRSVRFIVIVSLVGFTTFLRNLQAYL